VQAMNHARRALQKYLDRETGRVLTYPDFRTLRPGDSTERVRRCEVEFDAVHILVVPEWGGIRYPRSAWTYDMDLCNGLHRGAVSALQRAGRA
jgi:hypothetical protein